MVLSTRLAMALALVGECNVLADIGTDHAHLPIAACDANICKTAIACDINSGPLAIAATNINSAGYNARIATRLGSGLAPLSLNEADTIVIAGMGGMRIWQIIQQDLQKAMQVTKLVLQPQHDLEELRRNLHAAGFEITDEKLVKEDSRFYVLLCASYSCKPTPWHDHEYFIGKYLVGQPYFQEYKSQLAGKIHRYLPGLAAGEAQELARKKLKWLEG